VTSSLPRVIRELVAEDLAGPGASGLVGDDRREYARQQIFTHLDDVTSGDKGWEPCSTLEEEHLLTKSVLDALFGMGRLQALIDDPEIENIDINGYDRVWATYADGSKELSPTPTRS